MATSERTESRFPESVEAFSTFDDLLQSESFYRNPYPVFALLREREPVFWSQSWKCWLITRFDDADTILRDASAFSNADRFDDLLSDLATQLSDDAELEPLLEHCKLGVANADRPDHTRIRGLLAHGFRPRDVSALESEVQAIVDGLLDGVEGPEFDLITVLASPLPSIVIANALGVPAEDRVRFKQLIDATLFHGTGPAMLGRALGAVNALRALDEWITPKIQDRRAKAKDDLLTRLVLAKEDGDLLNDSELVTSCIVLVRAGQLTTQGLLGNGVLALLSHQEQWDRLVADPSLAANAVEEMLRYDTSFMRTLRRSTANTVIRGQKIAKNDLISVMLGAANRDPERHGKPDLFDIAREDTRHVGFGVGVHFCLGAALARLEVATALKTLVHRWPGLRLVEGQTVEWEHDNVNRHVRALRVHAD
jgi:cytochrome P450